MESKVFFSNIQKEITSKLLTSTKSIKVAVAWFTDKNLFDTLIAKAKNGVVVDLIVANHEVNRNCGIDFYALEQHNGTFSFIGNDSNIEPFMHHKFCIIDNETVIYGSYNWTNKATSNFENITVSKGDFKLIIDFISEFEKLKKFASDTSNSSGFGNRTNKDLLLKICTDNNIEYSSEMEFISKPFGYDEIVNISEDYIIVKNKIGEEQIDVVADGLKKYILTKEISWLENMINSSDDERVYVTEYPKTTISIWKYGVIDFLFNVIIPLEYDNIEFAGKDIFFFSKYEGNKIFDVRGDFNTIGMIGLNYKELVGLIDINNKRLINAAYNSFCFFKNGNIAAIHDNGIDFFNDQYSIFKRYGQENRFKTICYSEYYGYGEVELLYTLEYRKYNYNYDYTGDDDDSTSDYYCTWVIDHEGESLDNHYLLYKRQEIPFSDPFSRDSYLVHGSGYREKREIIPFDLTKLKNRYFLLTFEDYDNQIFFKKEG